MNKIAFGLAGCLVCTSVLAANQPPQASFTVSATMGTIGTVFTVDASATTDDHTQQKNLVFRWTWESGTPFQVAPKITTHQYAHEGIKLIRLDVVDQGGLIGSMTRAVTVQPTSISTLVANPPGAPGAGEPDIDFSRSDPQRVVMSAFTLDDGNGNAEYPAFVSSDGGASWTRATGVSGVHVSDAQIEMDRSGNVFLTAIDGYTEDGTPVGLQVSRSLNGGNTYSSASYAMDTSTLFRFPDGSYRSPGPCPPIPRLLYDRPVVGVDRSATSAWSGFVYIAAESYYFEDTNGDGICDGSYTVFVRSTDHGATWDAAQALGYRQSASAIAVGSTGVVFLPGTPQSGTSCSDGSGVILRRSTDGGSTLQPPICAAEAAAPYGAWPAAHPTDANKVVIAYSALTPATLQNPSHVYVARSSNGGTTWAPPVRVDDVLPDDAVHHMSISVAISSTGRVDAAWFDYRNGPNKSNPPGSSPGDVYYSFSMDGGATWAPNLRLTQTTWPLFRGAQNDFLTVSSSGNRVQVAYAEDTNGDGLHEAYVTTLTFH